MHPGVLLNQPPTGALCTWCKHYTPSVPPSGECSNCGGPLPPPPGSASASPPPASPRHIPEQYKKDLLFSKNVVAIVGLVFAIVGSVIAAIGLALVCVDPVVGIGLILFGAVFAGIGFPMRSHGRIRAKRQIDALTNGIAAEGTIVGVAPDYAVSVNGRHPTRIDYVFTAHGLPTSGATSGWDAVNVMRRPGERLWIVFLASDPSANSIWPPIA